MSMHTQLPCGDAVARFQHSVVAKTHAQYNYALVNGIAAAVKVADPGLPREGGGDLSLKIISTFHAKTIPPPHVLLLKIGLTTHILLLPPLPITVHARLARALAITTK